MHLEIKDLRVFYGKIEAIKGINVVVNQGEIVTLIGANGAGKTTTLKTISGLRPVTSGQILFDGQDISKVPAHERTALGISQAPEGRGIFPGMTVLENLEIGKYFRKDRKIEMEEDLRYKTSDLYLGAFLKLKGYKMSVEKNRNKAIFSFEVDSELNDLIVDYLNGEGSCEPLLYANSIKNLKNLIYNLA